jgi:hypothetical protein
MDAGSSDGAVWLAILARLGGSMATLHRRSNERFRSRDNPPTPDVNLARRHSHARATLTATIQILDMTGQSVFLSWHDSTACHYDYQRWTRTKARKGGTCALSGAQIMRGTYVYRPSQVPRPVNSESMILASAVEALIRERFSCIV